MALPRAATSEQSPAAAAAEAAAADEREESDDVGHQAGGGRSLVRARLRARLVDRCSQQLVDALEQKYGHRWTREVLQASFHVYESMLRICESFGLRPHLEAQVLWAVRLRAQGQARGVAEPKVSAAAAEVFLPFPLDHRDSENETPDARAAVFAEEGPLAPESDVAWSPTPSPCGRSPGSSVPTSPRLLSSTATSTAPSPTLAPLRALAPLPPEVPLLPQPAVSGEGAWKMILQHTDSREAIASWTSEECADHSEGSDGESSGEGEEAGEPALAKQQALHETGVTSAAEAGRRRPWLSWALWAVGGLAGDRQLTSGHIPIEWPSRSMAELAAAHDMPLADAPPAAGHALPAGARAKPAVPALASADRARRKDRACCTLRFAGSSEVCFFDAEDAQDGLRGSYQRPLCTKAFDGPSGHKARRRRHQAPVIEKRQGGLLVRLGLRSASALDTARIEVDEEEDESEDDEAVENEEDWQDQCNEIAELMSQQRHSLLWSASW